MADEPRAGGGGGVLRERLGPLPTWQWLAGITAALLAYFLYTRHKAASSSTNSPMGSSPTEPTASQSTVAGTQYIPDYVFQNSVYNEMPPTTINVGGGSTTSPPTTTPPVTTLPGTQSAPPITAPTSPGYPVPPSTGSKPSAPKYTVYTVKAGDNLSSIAAKYHTTWQTLFSVNTNPAGPHSAAAAAELKKQGPNLIYSGQKIYIPTS